MGYWLGERFWDRGIATEAVRAVTELCFDRFPLTRIFALPFAWNKASGRVLEKAGYTLEGRMRQSAVKDGKSVDQLLYAIRFAPRFSEAASSVLGSVIEFRRITLALARFAIFTFG